MKLINAIKQKIFFSFVILSLTIISPLYGQESIDEVTIEKSTESDEKIPDVLFSYENEDIINIINQLAAIKNVNIIFPPGDTLNAKVTLHIEKKISVEQAWNLLETLLDVAGFFIVPQGSMMRIVKSSKEMSREPMPTYIGVSPEHLPDTDQPIRYLYYLANIKVSAQEENEVTGIIKDILPENALYKMDPATNGLLLVAKSNEIRAVMKIIMELDRIDFQEKIDIISLRHVSANIVAELINGQLIKAENANPYRLDTKKVKEIPYFSGFTKIIPETRLNKLIILGRPQAVERLKDFIKKYIDVAPDTGESILHVYHLQYLNARDLAPVLMQIIQGGTEGNGPSQASAGEQKGSGVERFFNKVIVYTDSPPQQDFDSANTPIKEQRFTYYGGNNLVVAARNDDWKQIKKLIEELDIPQKQVLIEVLIADLTVEDTRLLGSMARVPDKISLPDSMEFQSAMLGQPIPSDISTNTEPFTPPTATINSDLLKNAYRPNETLANPSSSATTNLATFPSLEFGTTMLALNDNNGTTWSIWELLQLFANSKILSHPHVVTKNNKEAFVSMGQTRWLVDRVKDITGNYYGGATTIKQKPIAANLTVRITPRISSANTVNLQVSVDINEWQEGPGDVKSVRTLETNAYIKSGGIFALGGLIRTTVNNSLQEVPILGRIPILGWFFKRKRKEVRRDNLTVFISPTVIEPQLRQGINEYTQDYINVAKDYGRGDLFDSLKDPITRWFFRTDLETAITIDEFAAKDENLVVKKNTTKDKQMKKIINPDLYEIDSDDPITRKAGISIAANLPEKVDNPQHIPIVADLKTLYQDEPNPFLKS